MECAREAKCSPAGRTINFYISNSVVNIATDGQTKFSDQHRTENVNESTVFQSSKRTAFGCGGSDGRNQGQQQPPTIIPQSQQTQCAPIVLNANDDGYMQMLTNMDTYDPEDFHQAATVSFQSPPRFNSASSSHSVASNGSNFAPQIQMVHSQFAFPQSKRMLKLQPFQTQPEQVLKIEPQPLRTKRILKIQSPNELIDTKSDPGKNVGATEDVEKTITEESSKSTSTVRSTSEATDEEVMSEISETLSPSPIEPIEDPAIVYSRDEFLDIRKTTNVHGWHSESAISHLKKHEIFGSEKEKKTVVGQRPKPGTQARGRILPILQFTRMKKWDSDADRNVAIAPQSVQKSESSESSLVGSFGLTWKKLDSNADRNVTIAPQTVQKSESSLVGSFGRGRGRRGGLGGGFRRNPFPAESKSKFPQQIPSIMQVKPSLTNIYSEDDDDEQ